MRKKIYPAMSAVLAVSLLLTACGQKTEPLPETDEVAESDETTVEYRRDYSVKISELMAKNRATIMDGDGEFSDWIELENYGDEATSLEGLYLSDKGGRFGWALPAIELAAGERLIVFASSKDRCEGELHTDFSLSAGETLHLKNAYGDDVSALECIAENADFSVINTENGAEVTAYPTPDAANTIAEFIARQEARELRGPLIINEVCTHDVIPLVYEGSKNDWFEVKNISAESVNLSGFFVSDDVNNLQLLRLPEEIIEPGQIKLLYLGDDSFNLSSESDRLYLTGESGELIDYLPLNDIPYGGSIGRMNGQNGYFYFDSISPGEENHNGARFVSKVPSCASGDGVFEGVDEVKVELLGEGQIYYTTDGSLPTADSTPYTETLTLTETCVIRAVAQQDGGLVSRDASFSFIINEHHTLPVVSLCLDNAREYEWVWENGVKLNELKGNLAFYDGDKGFSIACGMKLNGETSLVLPKKNMSLRFRGAYGKARLEYDLYDGGATEFQNILLRAGQDYYNTVFRNELCQELCLDFSESVISQRSRFCVLYVNGEYLGVYTIKEKTNEALYAIMTGTKVENATALEATIWSDTELFQNVIGFAERNDMSDAANYAELCKHLDVDSMIDWLVAEGMCANVDLTSGNLRYVKSSELGDQWKLLHYDLDATFGDPEFIFRNVISVGREYQQVTALARNLLNNPDFRDRFLTRAGDAIKTSFSNEAIIAKIDALAAEIEPELERDFTQQGRTMASWYANVESLKRMITERDWAQCAIDNLTDILRLSPEEVEHYFG